MRLPHGRVAFLAMAIASPCAILPQCTPKGAQEPNPQERSMRSKTPAFRKKQYEAMGQYIRTLGHPDRTDMMELLARFFASDNAKFDEDKWATACGVQP